jgi:radical SAM superfamily enzyme YgiQ (UPF0313 family)
MNEMADTLKILLVNAIHPQVEVERRYPGLGLAYLAASARRELPEVNLEFRIADRDITRIARGFSPDLVGISSVTQNFSIARRYADEFARLGIPVIMGGIHLTSLPDCLPHNCAVACLGEAEISFVSLLRAFLEDRFNPDSFADIPGVVFWKDSVLYQHNTAKQQIADLDNLPMPARDLLTISPHAYMFTSRGCPYRCTFCASSRFWETLRFFSAEYVVEEIESLYRDHRVTMISFFDDLFTARPDRLEKIIGILEKRRLAGKIRFTCSCRANLVNPDLVKLLVRLGVVSVGIGLESGDDEILHYLKGGDSSVIRNRSAINLLKEAHIAVNGSFVIGSPQETAQQMMRTYRFIQESNLDLFDIYLLTPFPGTPIWDYARERGLVSDDMADWSCLDVNAYRSPERIIILSEVMDRKQVLKYYNRFRSLRWRRNMAKILHHPMRRDVPGMAWALFQEKISRFVNGVV